jgi:DNA-binding CsgD family transcriptional regulator
MQLAGRTLERPRYDPFSPREADVARLLLLGRTSTEIGSQLDISPETVKALRKRLLKKTNCKNAAELASYLQDHNFG